jgi:hypothetical protein
MLHFLFLVFFFEVISGTFCCLRLIWSLDFLKKKYNLLFIFAVCEIQVICTLGSVVFVSILLIRGIWTGITYLQEGRHQKVNEFDGDHRAWTGTQPST